MTTRETQADLAANAERPEPVDNGPEVSRWRTRRVTMPAFGVAFVAWWFLIGLPTDPLLTIPWLWLATIAWNPGRSWRHHLGFARDWAPIALLLVAYNFSRGAANDPNPHVLPMIHADRWLFDGHLPSVWLQQHFYDADTIHWYDVAASWVYFSHFVVSLTIAVVLWLRNRALWASFMRRWFALTALGLATYFLFPAAPPWWASEHGYVAEHVERMSGRGWDAIGLHSAGQLLNAGQALSNPVAAMPSLHSAFSACAIAFFLPMVRKRWWPLMLAYPLAMSVTLMYTGEHYAIDALVGWTYVVIVYTLVAFAERAWRHWRAAPEPAAPEPAAPVGSP